MTAWLTTDAPQSDVDGSVMMTNDDDDDDDDQSVTWLTNRTQTTR